MDAASMQRQDEGSVDAEPVQFELTLHPLQGVWNRILAKREIIQFPDVDGPCWYYTGRARPGHFAEGEPDNQHRKIWVTGEGSMMRPRGRMEYVHRISYRYHFGEIGENVIIRHACDHRPCFAPHHLTTGDQSANMKEMFARGRGRCQFTPRGGAPDDDCPF